VNARIAACAALVLLAACSSTQRAPPSVVHVRLLAFNDFHGYLDPPDTPTRWTESGTARELATGGAARLAGEVARLRADSPLNAVIAAGDLVGGSPLMSALLRHEPSIEALNDLGLEFSSLGNHEFDRGVPELLRLQNGGCHPSGEQTCAERQFAGARFRYLAANVRDEANGRTLLSGWASKRFPLPGGEHIDVGFIGLVLRDTPALVSSAAVQGLRFDDEAAAANALVPQLRASGIETIVVLMHEGGRTTASRFDDTRCPGFSGSLLRIAAQLDPAIDVIVSGHTHVPYVCRFDGRLITSAGAEGRFLTQIDLDVDSRTRNVQRATARQHAIVHAPGTDPVVAAEFPVTPELPALALKIAHWREKAAPLTGRVVGRVAANLTRRADSNGETSLGELVADAQLEATRGPEVGAARIAFVNDAGLRADLQASDRGISYGEIYAVHPFGNLLVTMTLTGRQIHALLEQQWQGAGSLLQVSRGFGYSWRAEAPAGARVDPEQIVLDGERLEPEDSYRVTVSDFLAGGGDGYTTLREGKDPLRGAIDVDVLEAFIRTHTPVEPPVAGRVRRQ
jgi:5'-nucleotidase